MCKRLGRHTVKLEKPVYITAAASTAGKKEGEGPLAGMFDIVLDDDLWGEQSWEKAESKLVRETFSLVIKKAEKEPRDIDLCVSGDLLDQVSASTFGLRDIGVPYLGIYGACSTMGEAMGLASMLIDGGFAENIAAGASSHFCAAEKQYRAPLGMGNQRPPTTTWTVTGDGAVMLSKNGKKDDPIITEVLTGEITDLGVKDTNNMGAAMAPAAAELMKAYFDETGIDPDYFDLIATGDLGYVGQSILFYLVQAKGYDIREKHMDCGMTIYDQETQDTHAGGSGCGCAAVTLASYVLPKVEKGEWKRVLFVPTGALMSTVSFNEGASVPGIAHGIVIEHCG